MMNIWQANATAFLRKAGLKDRLKLWLGSVVYPHQTRRWHRFLSAHPVLEELARCYPRLIHKIYTPYLSNRLRCADRVDFLIDHYALLFNAGFGDFVGKTARLPLTVCAFHGKSGTSFQLQISAINDGHREGELCLRLLANGTCIYSVTFILLILHGKSYIKIGCLQGLRCAHGALWIKHVSKELHGHRPKNLMVSIVRNLGAYFECSGLLLVSNENRIALNVSRRGRILADYDLLWRELRATRRSDGDYELGCAFFQKTDLDIPSRKRSETRKRNALAESIFTDVRNTLARMKQPAAGESIVCPVSGKVNAPPRSIPLGYRPPLEQHV